MEAPSVRLLLSSSPHQDRYAERARLRGMPEDRELVGTPAYLSFRWARGLLRPIARQTLHQAFSDEWTPDHRGLRSIRGLGLVLCRRYIHRARSSHAAARSDTAVRTTIAFQLLRRK